MISPTTVRYLTKSAFQNFGKQILVDVKRHFRLVPNTVMGFYQTNCGVIEPIGVRGTKRDALDNYFQVLNDHIDYAAKTFRRERREADAPRRDMPETGC